MPPRRWRDFGVSVRGRGLDPRCLAAASQRLPYPSILSLSKDRRSRPSTSSGWTKWSLPNSRRNMNAHKSKCHTPDAFALFRSR